MAYSVREWHDFFLMLGGASAALAGLVFVGLSLHASRVAVDAFYRVRARNLTAGIVYVTIVSALALIPGQGPRLFGAELVAGGLLIGALFAEPLVRFRDRVDSELRIRTGIATTACVLSAVGGASVIAHTGGGLYLVVPAAIAGVTMNVFGAWSLLLNLARETDVHLHG